jgi:hypothetical protein
VELLAHHYEAGGEPVRAKAVAALIEAGDVARRRAASDDAIRFAERALALATADADRVAALEVKARALHASVRSDDALTAYMEALALADDEVTIGRLRAHAVLMCARYPGAFTRRDWTAWAVAAIDAGLAADGDEFNTAALLIGRASMGRWFQMTPDERRTTRAAAERAVEIAERIGSTYLLSHALEALGWRDADDGFCEAGETADRMLSLVGRMSDRSEIGETMVVATVCLLRAGRHADAWETASEVAQRSADLSTHRRLHAAAAQAACLAPAGRLPELDDATAPTLDWIIEEGDRACAMATFGLAGQALARYESLDPDGGERCAALVEAIGLHRNDSAFRMLGVELLRPFVGFECTRRRIEASDELRGLVEGVHHTRAQLQLVTLEGSDPVDDLVTHAHELARRACAPALGWIADWAQAVRAGSLERALAATAALDRYGEHYTAARLEVDALVRMPDAAAATKTATRLERMGARASAAELSGIRGD